MKVHMIMVMATLTTTHTPMITVVMITPMTTGIHTITITAMAPRAKTPRP
jgi:hypothetical protein